MAGSRKGERRGGAKPNILRVKKADKPILDKPVDPDRPGRRGAYPGEQRRKGIKNKPKFDPVKGILARNRGPMDRERELEMYFLVTGKRGRMPKEVMLDAMRYFEERAIECGEVAYANLKAAGAAQTPEEREIFNTAATLEEMRLREYLISSVDVAYKVAPFIHPRLAAVITKTGDDSSPTSLLSTLMRELDEAGRPPRFIDHDDREFEGGENG